MLTGHVATRLRHYGRGKRSGVVIDEELYHQVATVRVGRMVRLELRAMTTRLGHTNTSNRSTV